MTVLFIRHKAAFLPQARAALLSYTNYYQAILSDPDTGLSHTRSLSVEEQFYILWPALFLWGKSRLPQLTRLLIAVICSLWIYRAVLKYGFHVWQGYFYEAFDTRADQLLLGCLLAVVLWTGQWNKFWVTVCGLPQLASTALALVVSAIVQQQMGAAYRDVFGLSIDAVLVALLIVQLISARRQRSLAWLQSATVKYLGRISYSLYLYQQLVLPRAQKSLSGYASPVRVGGAILALVAVASASYYFIEKPFLALKARTPGRVAS